MMELTCTYECPSPALALTREHEGAVDTTFPK